MLMVGNLILHKFIIKTSHGTYVSVKTGTTNGPDMIPIKPTQKGISQSYVKKRPFEGTRKDYGDHEVIGVSFHPDDQDIIEDVKKRKPRLTKRARYRYK